MFWSQREVKVFRLILALFLDTSLRTTLENIKGTSSSTASRFLSCEHVPDEVYWQEINRWQLRQFEKSLKRGKRGRRKDVVLKLDLTCIEKTGKKIPFARVFNKQHGIQLVVLHACVNGLSFPLGYRIYEGKAKQAPVALALELLALFPASSWSSRVVVMADAGYGSTEFIQGCEALGFSRLLVGVRCDRKLSDKRRIDQLKKRGQAHQLHNFNKTLWVTWCDVKRDKKKKRFFLLSTFKAGGAYLAKRYRQRWLIESFFKSIKHDFGLKEARLRTKGGIKLWIFFACLAYSFASLERFLTNNTISFCDAAKQVLESLTDIVLLFLMLDCQRFNQLSIHHSTRVNLVFV